MHSWEQGKMWGGTQVGKERGEWNIGGLFTPVWKGCGRLCSLSIQEPERHGSMIHGDSVSFNEKTGAFRQVYRITVGNWGNLNFIGPSFLYEWDSMIISFWEREGKRNSGVSKADGGQENLGWLQERRAGRCICSDTREGIVFRHPEPAAVASKGLVMVTISTLWFSTAALRQWTLGKEGDFWWIQSALKSLA